jgi:DNA modification methylase
MGKEENTMIEWNTVKYIDCMDPDEGLPSLPDKSIDLGYTDPPWGYNEKVKLSQRNHMKRPLNAKNKDDLYNDIFDEDFMLNWFNEFRRVCKNVIVIPGRKYFFWYIRNTDPTDFFIIYMSNLISASKISTWNKLSPYLCWGKFKPKLHSNHISSINRWGFLSREKYKHPYPKGTEIVLKILRQLKPKSLLDPFAGSGSFLKAADILGIPWIGYEKERKYKVDIDKRFRQKIILEEWIK